ncbi:YbaB/EbfC family nucleoid-associated protein [Candidatus Cardinium hertigii]|uniref:Nucleoid-associated protein EDM02_04195 n=1 Tax=Candidatus Cardinium hertigii TaxID=247481 RepID=A0A3N2QB82_9BACT|nr:YbaB/EbfC family nucleoid-associated protein [Candidatus Cardinium hertigii]ROT47065.1 YbaB/EbfC family nucleoid-associated protein [Candidatus Cardinium hertigii]
MDITKLFGQVEQVRKKMEEFKQEMAQVEVTKETGAGLVKATVNGNKELLSVSIDPSLLNKQDQKMVQDLIVGAVNLALEEVENKVQAVIQKSAIGI